jgi:hypothetical protein
MKLTCSLHALKADDLLFAHVDTNGHVAAVDSSTGVQLHWDSIDDFEVWVDRLYNLMHAKAVAA